MINDELHSVFPGLSWAAVSGPIAQNFRLPILAQKFSDSLLDFELQY
jgi:hypothetical protein